MSIKGITVTAELSFDPPKIGQTVCVDGIEYEGSVDGNMISVTVLQPEMPQILNLWWEERRPVSMVDQKGQSFVALPLCIDEVVKKGEEFSITFIFERV